ncbi:BMP family lipoprotein [Aquibacillus rhizosphaerae]|uniref:BMP family ABC transporter substrate-binding protein n=1 Tax=Aquibacillus rhizosphaerae TaxID=3051431 RepID=A0ABT7KZN9_9BACI|nr:BMP family ABC transporter substrate-binding protein [Aquibacillus sp. LR5S19]MDL4839007.1 BMP family ABC transporter substrate-binding protein [Aquibacillus sp. LR5S19]
MKKNRFLLILVLLLSLGLVLAACGTDEDDSANETDDNTGTEGTDEATEEETEATDFQVGMVTDIGGVDDKSFNQSAWEGLTAFGEANGLSKGEGIDYVQSANDADYLPNLNRLVQQDYNLVFGIGYLLAEAVTEVAGQNPDTNFAIVDSVVEADNVASITFQEHQGSFLVGVAAALKTESNKVGFVGGVEGDLIKKFEAGFTAGVKSVDPNIEVVPQYADSFGAPDKGKAIAASMYNSDVDVIYHASGGTGNGVFAQAKDIKNNDPDAYVWVIGVDRDQYEEGTVGDTNVTLTSMVKRVDIAVQSVTQQALENEFPGGEILAFGIQEDGVGVAKTNEEAYTAEIDEVVQEWKTKILDGDVEVPATDEELEAYLESL